MTTKSKVSSLLVNVPYASAADMNNRAHVSLLSHHSSLQPPLSLPFSLLRPPHPRVYCAPITTCFVLHLMSYHVLLFPIFTLLLLGAILSQGVLSVSFKIIVWCGGDEWHAHEDSITEPRNSSMILISFAFPDFQTHIVCS